MTPPRNTDARFHVLTLAMLMGLFAFRVAAQLIQFALPNAILPAFEVWHSATLPYPILVLSQFMILLAQGWAIRRVIRRSRWSRRAGWLLLVFGSVYLASMLGRIAVGIFGLSNYEWFDAYLPAAFHIVLALFVLTLAHFVLWNSSVSPPRV